VPLQESVEVPEVPRLTVVGVRVQVRPADGKAVVAIVTDPVKPWSGGRAVMVIVDVPAVPALTVTELGPAATVKS